MKSINPFNNETIKTFDVFTDEQVEKTLSESVTSFENWKKTSYEDRSALFQKLSVILKSKADPLAKLMTQEMGKLSTEAKSEILKCAQVCEFYAQNTKEFLKDQVIETDASKSFVTFQPLGTILGIMPWNFPFWQVLRFAAPTMMAGNVVILKHASNVPRCAIEIERLFQEAGFPKNAFQTVLLPGDRVAKLIADHRIAAVTLTGSTEAGKSVAQAAGAHLKKSVLELGGSDAYIVLDDANLESAVKACVKSRLINAGQSCIAAKRFIVVSKHYDEFKSKMVEHFEKLKMGDPQDTTTTLAPLARLDLRDNLHKQVKKAIGDGATLVIGGTIPALPGAFYGPTILENLTPDNEAFYDEFFGPVALLFKVKNEEEAIDLANATSFGLGSAVFTADVERGTKIAKENLQAGNAFVNTFVRSDPRLPFGGIKSSGYGRELSHFGIFEFTNIKTVCVD